MRTVSLAVLPLALAALLCVAEVSLSPQDQTRIPSSPAFEFHSSFWINLDHFLYLQGRIRNAATVSTQGDPAQPQFLAPASTEGMTAEQKTAWNGALRIYAADWSTRDLQSNGDMVLINNRLTEMDGCADLSGKSGPACASGLRPDLIAALDEAAPIYRTRWWPEQDRENRAWITGVAPQVRTQGGELARQLSEIYRSEWTGPPIRVDVVWYAGPEGAYTTLMPSHITVSSHDTRNQGPAAFAVLFDAASHTIGGDVQQEIAEQCRRQNKPIPRDLWPALLFYTTSELVRQKSANGDHDALQERGWGSYEGILGVYWQPYLDNRVGLDIAIARLVTAL